MRDSEQQRSQVDRLEVRLTHEEEIPRDRLREWASANMVDGDELSVIDADTGTLIGMWDGDGMAVVEDPNPYGSRFVAGCSECLIQSDFVRKGAVRIDGAVLLVGTCIQCGAAEVERIDTE